MKQPAKQIDDELTEWEELLTADVNQTEREELDDETRSRWDVDADDAITQEREELNTTLEYEVDESGRVTYKHDMGFWEAAKHTFGPDSYLSTRSKAIIAGAYAFAIVGVPLLAWGFAKGMTALVGSATVWYGLAFVALAVFYIKWAAKVISA